MDTKNFLNRLSKHKNLIFLIMCLGVHALNAVLFSILRLWPLMGLNVLSTIFYLCMLVLYKKESDNEIILIYSEIILFSAVSDLLIGGIYNYIFFIIGMLSVISYLLSDKSKHKHLIQAIGAVVTIGIYFARLKNVCIMPNLAIKAIDYRVEFGVLNIVITIITLVYVSGLYTIELQTTKEKLKYASTHDTLTNLYNRRFFEQTIERSVNENSKSYTIAMFDVDNFKKVNDTYGHDAGDRVLETISNCLSKNLEGEQLAIRWGGEEFILYIPCMNLDDSYNIVSKICEEIRNTEIQLKNLSTIKVTVTVGMESSNDLSAYEDVIKKADEKLYKGKTNGKNCIVKD